MASTPDVEKPSVSDVEENRIRLCDEFAAVSGTDRAVAQCYLAENEWEMEVHIIHHQNYLFHYCS